MRIRVLQKPSANYVNEEIQPKYIVIHCIGYDEAQALSILTDLLPDGNKGASAHYFIPQHESSTTTESGYSVYQLVADTKRAFHAGVSQWGADSALNGCSIGIEFSSPDYAYARSGKGTLDWLHFEEFDDKQICAGMELLISLINKYQIQPQHILGHSDIAPYRLNNAGELILGKTDPGATFPWERLAKAGIGVWPKRERTRSGELDTSTLHVQQLLTQYGYALPVSGEFDRKTQYVTQAFQMHFLPQQVDGKISAAMVIYLENLLDKQYQYKPLLF